MEQCKPAATLDPTDLSGPETAEQLDAQMDQLTGGQWTTGSQEVPTDEGLQRMLDGLRGPGSTGLAEAAETPSYDPAAIRTPSA